jgi:hypothetical protein
MWLKDSGRKSSAHTMPFVLGEIPFISPASIDVAGSNPFVELQIERCMDHNQRWLYERLRQTQEVLENAIPENLKKRCAVLVVGSDGRMENAPGSILLSPLEFCIIAICEEDAVAIDAYIKEQANAGHLLSVYAKAEYKILNQGNMSGYDGDPRRAWPDRVLDSAFLVGSFEVINEAYSKVFEEWVTNGKIRENVRHNFTTFLKTTQTGISRGKQHFDRETGKILFDKEEYIRGLKYGPIRLLQSLLTIKQLNTQQRIAPLDTNTIAKLLTLYPDATEVADAYREALFIYHTQQEQRSLGADGVVEVEPERLNKVLDIISTFADEEMRKMYPKRN